MQGEGARGGAELAAAVSCRGMKSSTGGAPCATIVVVVRPAPLGRWGPHCGGRGRALCSVVIACVGMLVLRGAQAPALCLLQTGLGLSINQCRQGGLRHRASPVAAVAAVRTGRERRAGAPLLRLRLLHRLQQALVLTLVLRIL